MNNQLKRVLVLVLLLFLTVAVISCTEEITFFTTTNTSSVSSTDSTVSTDTTIDTVSSSTQTVITMTTDVSSTTTHIETTVPTTQVPTTTITTTEPITTSGEPTTTTVITTVFTTTYQTGGRIEITVPGNLVYTINDDLDLQDLEVSYFDSENIETVLGSNDYIVSEVDMSTYGVKTVIITYQSYSASFNIQVNLPNYYMSAMNLSGNALLLELRSIVNSGFDGVSYGEARYILDETDEDPNNSNNVIQVYTGLSVSGTWSCATAATCNWNREHVWPQSAMPVEASNSVTNMASDLHNLKPSDYYENSYRGNKYFDNVNSSVAYEPRDEVKGDVARIMLYMIVMYDELTLVDSTPNTANLEMGLFSVLLAWNEADPVDDFERNRNDVIYSYQFNYNPFIDYPEFAELIWD